MSQSPAALGLSTPLTHRNDVDAFDELEASTTTSMRSSVRRRRGYIEGRDGNQPGGWERTLLDLERMQLENKERLQISTSVPRASHSRSGGLATTLFSDPNSPADASMNGRVLSPVSEQRLTPSATRRRRGQPLGDSSDHQQRKFDELMAGYRHKSPSPVPVARDEGDYVVPPPPAPLPAMEEDDDATVRAPRPIARLPLDWSSVAVEDDTVRSSSLSQQPTRPRLGGGGHNLPARRGPTGATTSGLSPAQRSVTVSSVPDRNGGPLELTPSPETSPRPLTTPPPPVVGLATPIPTSSASMRHERTPPQPVATTTVVKTPTSTDARRRINSLGTAPTPKSAARKVSLPQARPDRSPSQPQTTAPVHTPSGAPQGPEAEVNRSRTPTPTAPTVRSPQAPLLETAEAPSTPSPHPAPPLSQEAPPATQSQETPAEAAPDSRSPSLRSCGTENRKPATTLPSRRHSKSSPSTSPTTGTAPGAAQGSGTAMAGGLPTRHVATTRRNTAPTFSAYPRRSTGSPAAVEPTTPAVKARPAPEPSAEPRERRERRMADKHADPAASSARRPARLISGGTGSVPMTNTLTELRRQEVLRERREKERLAAEEAALRASLERPTPSVARGSFGPGAPPPASGRHRRSIGTSSFAPSASSTRAERVRKSGGPLVSPRSRSNAAQGPEASMTSLVNPNGTKKATTSGAAGASVTSGASTGTLRTSHASGAVGRSSHGGTSTGVSHAPVASARGAANASPASSVTTPKAGGHGGHKRRGSGHKLTEAKTGDLRPRQMTGADEHRAPIAKATTTTPTPAMPVVNDAPTQSSPSPNRSPVVAELPSATRATGGEEAEPPTLAPVPFCIECGRRHIDDYAKFCAFCGQKRAYA